MANEPKITSIKELRPGMKNLNMVFIVLEIGTSSKTKDGHEIRSCKVADKTGCINMSAWDELGRVIQAGDMLKLTKGYASLFRGSLTLYTGIGGKLHKIGDFCMVFSEIPNMSEPNAEFIAQQKVNLQEQRSNSPTGPGASDGRPPNNGGPRMGPNGNPNQKSTFEQQPPRPPTPPMGVNFPQPHPNRGGMGQGGPKNGMGPGFPTDQRGGRGRRGR
ncbi:SOSS complex subunit B1-like [Acanthaster planci]|uniref:SOSS complex subunit B1-like n=1 Tax=Acanthaster planci TaxID=133434 RepID=A0A8B7ZV95_ACAPL|nr:SOSS complex subunit B1-like [Acanthaster planci]